MYNRLLQNQCLSCLSFALTTLLLAPTQSQSFAPSNATETEAARMQRYQEATKRITATQKQYQDTHKAVFVTVDYVDVPRTDLIQASQWIASGQEHDARLLAALVKNGAQDTKGTQVKAWDKMTVANGKAVPSAFAGGNPLQPHTIYSYTEATPKFNADGTITVLIRLELGQVRGFSWSASKPGYQCVSQTFRDGQTLEIGNSVSQSPTGESLAHLTFVRAATSASEGDTIGRGDPEQILDKPLGNSITVTP